MTRALIVHRAGPGVTVQDLGRPGYLAFGLSRGGAADRLALAEGAALLGQGPDSAALELAGMGGEFAATEDLRIALTGAPMRASIDGDSIAWNASHLLPKGARLVIGAAEAGTYGYLHLGGGLEDSPNFWARRARIWPPGSAGRLRRGKPAGRPRSRPGAVGMKLPRDDRFDGGPVRLVPSLQTGFFPPDEIERFQTTTFRRDTRGNRMGVRILPDGEGFHTEAGLTVLSEVIVPGDVQITGDGTPFVLLSECQTTGGYPRIGSVLPADLPRVAQARPGAELRFRFVTLDEAVAIERREAEARHTLRARITPLIRDPSDIADLLSYQLVGGVTAGDDLEREQQ